MPREETRHPFAEEEKGKVLDPNPERRRYLTELFHKFVTHKISAADLMGMSKKRFARLAEVGYVKYKYGRYDEALTIFNALAKLDSVNAYYHMALGGVYQKLDRHVEAVVSYTRAIRVSPKDLCPYVNRGEIYLRHKNFKKAAEDFKLAILADPDGKSIWANRARSLVIALKRTMDLRKRMQQQTAARQAQAQRPPPKPSQRPVRK